MSNLYGPILEQLYKVIKPEGRVVFLFPFIKNKRIPFPKHFEKQWERVNVFEDITEVKSERGGIDYKRPNQYIGREIMILKKR